MTDGDTQLLVKLFLALRQRNGLTAERLRQRPADSAVLTDLQAVMARAADDNDPYPAAVTAVADAALQLDTTRLLIVDAALNLRVTEKLAATRSRENSVAATLYADNIGDRRATLVAAWDQLHQLLIELRGGATNADVPPRPTIGALRDRDGFEYEAFQALAAAMTSPTRLDVVPELGEVPQLRRSRVVEPLMVNGHPARAAVVGAAVMDAIFVIERMPAEDHSAQAREFYLHPGGKGLVQAVAATRLGMKTSLVAHLGMDPFGKTILTYMHDAGLTPDFVKDDAGAQSPMTAVIVPDDADGGSIALGWKGHARVDSNPLVAENYSELLRESDVLFLTFEPPVDVVEQVLETCLTLAEDAPHVVLTPAPPYDDKLPSATKLAAVDVIVANQWEAERLVARDARYLDVRDVVRMILGCGVDALCIFDKQGVCTVNVPNEPVIVQPPIKVARRGTAGARDAFCAALAHQLLTRQELDREAIGFAMAAWSASIRDLAVPESMPYLKDIEAILRYRDDDESQ